MKVLYCFAGPEMAMLVALLTPPAMKSTRSTVTSFTNSGTAFAGALPSSANTTSSGLPSTPPERLISSSASWYPLLAA